MIDITLEKKDVERIQALLEDLSPKKREGAVHKGMLKASDFVLKDLVTNVSGRILRRRTGNLANSISYKVEQDSDGVYGALIGSGVALNTKRMIYANILEEGGRIIPKKAQMLTVPLDKAKTPAGVARFSAREITSNGYAGSFVRKSKNGQPIIFGIINAEKKFRAVPLFVLVPYVDIGARRYMEATANETDGKVVEKICEEIEKRGQEQ